MAFLCSVYTLTITRTYSAKNIPSTFSNHVPLYFSVITGQLIASAADKMLGLLPVLNSCIYSHCSKIGTALIKNAHPIFSASLHISGFLLYNGTGVTRRSKYAGLSAKYFFADSA